ncbi:MAG: hypothetical protein NVS4B8_15940 [Herpetosiphon sp.]
MRVENQTATIMVAIFGCCEAGRLHWSWLAVDGDEHELAIDQGAASPMGDGGSAEACALAVLSALQWAAQQGWSGVVVYTADRLFVDLVGGLAEPASELGVLTLIMIHRLLHEVAGSVEYIEGDWALISGAEADGALMPGKRA